MKIKEETNDDENGYTITINVDDRPFEKIDSEDSWMDDINEEIAEYTSKKMAQNGDGSREFVIREIIFNAVGIKKKANLKA